MITTKVKKYGRSVRYSWSELSMWRTNKAIDNMCGIKCKDICFWILQQGKEENVFHEYKRNNGEQLTLGYSEARAAKDAYNRIIGIERLHRFGVLRKDYINR